MMAKKLSSMQLVAGMGYVNYRHKSADQFTLKFGRESVTLAEAAHFRVGLRNNEATVAGDQRPLECERAIGTD